MSLVHFTRHKAFMETYTAVSAGLAGLQKKIVQFKRSYLFYFQPILSDCRAKASLFPSIPNSYGQMWINSVHIFYPCIFFGLSF